MDYAFRANTFLKEHSSDPARRVQFEIGDSKHPDIFIPQQKFLFHDNIGNFSARLAYDDYSIGKLSAYADRIDWEVAEFVARFYETQGGSEFEIILKSPPPFPWIDLSIQGKEFVYLPQPAITAQDKAEGCHQPDEYVDSVAIYYANRRGNQNGGLHFLGGKALHVKRIQAADATGKKVWGKIEILGAELWRLHLDPTFLATAVYPIAVDPNFGDETNGSVTATLEQNIHGTAFEAPASGTLTSVSTYYNPDSSAFAMKGVVYARAGANDPGSLLGTGAEVTGVTGAAYRASGSISLAITVGTFYFLSAGGNTAPGSNLIHYDATGDGFQVGFTYATFPDPPAAETVRDRIYSIYATYTVAGGNPWYAYANQMAGAQ